MCFNSHRTRWKTAWDASWEEPVCGAECSGLVCMVRDAALGRVRSDGLKHDLD